MKRLFLIMCVLVLLLSAVACSTEEPAPAPEKTETKTETDAPAEETEAPKVDVRDLQFRITWAADSGRGEAINKLVTAYNEQNEGATIVLVGGDEDLANIMTSDVDIYQMPYRYVGSLGQEGLFKDVTADLSEEASYFYDAVVDLGSVGDTMYGIPWIGHSMSLIYNKDLLDAAGVNPDEITSWDAYVEALQAVEDNTDAKGMGLVGKQVGDVSWMAQMFVYSFGGSLVDEAGTTVTINSDEAKAGLDFYFNTLGQYAQDGWQEHDGGGVMEAFRTQNVAFEIQGPWGVTDIWKQAEENQFTVGTMPLSQLTQDGINGHAEIGPHMLTVNESLNDDEYAEAIKFIKYMVSKEAQEMIMDGEYNADLDAYYPFRVPLRTDMADSAFFTEHPEFLAFIEGFEYPSIESPVADWAEIREKYVLPGYNAIATGAKTIDEVLAEIESEGNKVLK